MQTAEQTAIMIALMMKRSDRTRARVSQKTVRILSRRRLLRTAFIDDVRTKLEDLDLGMLELGSGGFGVIKISALEGQKPCTAAGTVPVELSQLKNGSLDWEELKKELGLEDDTDEDGD